MGNKIYEKLTNPKIVKISMWVSSIIVVSCITLGVIVAVIGPPGGYNPIDNYISDLGGSPYTPFPYFLDIASMVSGILLVPTLFYMEKLLVPRAQNTDGVQSRSKMRFFLGKVGFAWMLFGLFGWFNVGLFSEDRNYYNLHFYASLVCFVGLALGGVFFGLLISLYDTIFPRKFGIYMIILPSIACTVLIFGGLLPIAEWIFFFSVFGWIIPGFMILMKHLEN